jgi:hypothetical protein
MVPSAAEIMRRRHQWESRLRALSLCMLIFALFPLLSWLAEGLADEDLTEYLYYLPRIVAFLLSIAVAAFGRFAGRSLARWIVPIPDVRCPRCDYRLDHLSAPRCPECGLPLPDELVKPNDESPVAGETGIERGET